MMKTPLTLVFVHGGFCGADDWRSVVDILAGEYPIIAPALPGHDGATAQTPTITALGETLAQTLQATPGALVVGHSMGCAVALEAVLHANTAAGLILIEGAMGRTAAPERTPVVIEATIEALGWDTFIDQLVGGWSLPPRLRAAAHERLARMDPGFARALLIDALRWENDAAVARLSTCSAPLIAVQTTRADGAGRQSLKAGESAAWLEFIQHYAPHAGVRALDGLGHFPHVEAPGVIARLVREFAEDLAP